MATTDKISLTSRWCFLRSELVIGFPSSRLALQYQSLHPESRIYTKGSTPHYRDGSEKEIYLPHPEGLTALRSSSQWASTYSLVLDFSSATALMEWQRRATLISTVFAERPTSAYICREIKSEALNAPPPTKSLANLNLNIQQPPNSKQPELYIQDPKNPKRFIHYDPSRDRRDRQRQT